MTQENLSDIAIMKNEIRQKYRELIGKKVSREYIQNFIREYEIPMKGGLN